jgi:hypothetical protein
MPNQKSKRSGKKSQARTDATARQPDHQGAKQRKQAEHQQAEGPQPDKHGGSGSGRQQGGSGAGRERG